MPTAASSIYAYPTTVTGSVGLPSALHTSVLVNENIGFQFEAAKEEYTDHNTMPDTLLYHTPKISVSAEVAIKDVADDFMLHAPGAAFTLASLGLSTASLYHGFTVSSAYLVQRPFTHQWTKGKLGSMTLEFDVHGFSAGTVHPASGTYPQAA